MANELYLWQMRDAATGGHKFGLTTSDKIAFYGGTPVARQSLPDAVETTLSVSTTSNIWGFSTSTQADALVTGVNSLRTILSNLGIAA